MQTSYEKYRDQSISTMTQGEMVVRLYDEIVKQLGLASHYIEVGDVLKSNESLQKCQRILNHLNNTLDFKYEISKNLSALYDFFIRQVVSANIKKDKKLIDEILPLLEELRETFAQGERLARQGSSVVKQAAVAGARG